MSRYCQVVLAPLSGVKQDDSLWIMVHVYILQSLNDKGYYIGICKDLDKRLNKHNHGAVRSTKSRRPFRIVRSEDFNNYAEARIREKELKSYKGGNEFKKLIT